MWAPRAVQLRHATGLTAGQYVSQQGWLAATLVRCPLHPEGGCGFARHTTYGRVEPEGTQIARYYCPAGHRSFSLLPDCYASRLSSTLQEVEQIVARVEQDAKAGVTTAATAQKLCPNIELQGALRWIGRRVVGVRAALAITVGLLPGLLAGTPPTLAGFRQALGAEQVLPAVRERAGGHLAHLPPPVGFGPRSRSAANAKKSIQHETGPDPGRVPS